MLNFPNANAHANILSTIFVMSQNPIQMDTLQGFVVVLTGDVVQLVSMCFGCHKISNRWLDWETNRFFLLYTMSILMLTYTVVYWTIYKMAHQKCKKCMCQKNNLRFYRFFFFTFSSVVWLHCPTYGWLQYTTIAATKLCFIVFLD